eukprot:TRINITY_DN14996_c0_g1_i1.p1 TRINITY_DN14996_c0_g1~~TRINITY_DN14996_c0_g1_i1.p1  ORF type:complete len:829 (-),score=259.87 TRINITY_DN14996_c0_g1_i1:18-2504(-)
MGRKQKLGKTRLDKFYHLAKEQGYRSRAAFKLIQLNRKYNFLANARALIDLCAAPGGWLQVASKYMPVSSIIIGVDLVPIKPIKNVITLTEDITTASCRAKLREHLKEWNADVVLHDGAPNVGAEWAKDAYSQAELTLHSLKLATQFLGPGGTFVTKVFRSGDYNSLLWVFQQLFKKVEATKPQASRSTSAEIFVVCTGYLAPKKIDPKMLDPQSVFVQVAPTITSAKQLEKSLTDRHRDGYDDNNPTMYRTASVAAFIGSQDPVKMMLDYNKLIFDDASKEYENHPLTDDTIIQFCDDIKLMSKFDFRKLLKWRLRMKEVEHIRAKMAADKAAAAIPVVAEDEGTRLARELDEMAERAQKRKKSVKRKLKKQRTKQQQRLALKLSDGAQDIIQDEPVPLFSLSSIKTLQGLKHVTRDADDVTAEQTMDADFAIPSDSDSDAEVPTAAVDSDDEESAYQLRVEEMLDQMYEQYLSKQNKRMMAGDRPRQQDEDDHEKLGTVSFLSKKEEQELADSKQNPLLKADRVLATANMSQRASMWFSQPIFADMKLDGDLKAAQNKRKRDPGTYDSDSEDDDVPEDEDGAEDSADSASSDDGSGSDAGDAAAETESDSDSDSDMDDVEDSTAHVPADVDLRARTLALATDMRHNKRKRDEFVDNAFNRYSWNDDGAALPPWFRDEEHQHNKPDIPVTKELVDQYKAKFAAIDARPIKKVLEAQARKKKRQSRAIERAKNTATKIAEDTELTEGAKGRAIEKLYAKAGAKAARQRKPMQVLVSNRGGVTGQKKKGSRVKVVDSRLKKDMRNQKKRGKTGTAPKGSVKKRARTSRK